MNMYFSIQNVTTHSSHYTVGEVKVEMKPMIHLSFQLLFSSLYDTNAFIKVKVLNDVLNVFVFIKCL